MRQAKERKRIDKLIEAAYYRHGRGVQINVMNISKVFDAGRAALAAGADLNEAIKTIIARYQEN